MTIKNKMISVCLMFLVAFSVVGCSSKDTKKSNDFISTENMKLIYEETISPNKEYVEKEEDIDIEWTTIMGNPTPTKEDLLAIAYVSISEDGKVISKRKISFINKAIEIIEDALDKK